MQESLLEIQNLKKYFTVRSGLFRKPSGYIKAIDEINISLHKNQSLALVGESGSGKSTIGRLIMQLLNPYEGTIKFLGQDLKKLDYSGLKKIKQDIQMIFQDSLDAFNPQFKIFDILKEPLEIHFKLTKNDIQEKVETVCQLVGINKNILLRYPNELSGGQRQRIAIARALILEPQLIIADESVSALDISIQSQILNLLIELREKLGLSLLFITHDLTIIKAVCDEVIVLYLGKIVEYTSIKNFFSETKHPYSKGLLNSIPTINPRDKQQFQSIQGEIPNPIHRPKGCCFHTRCPFAFEKCKHEEPILKNVQNQNQKHLVACHYYEIK